MTRERHTEEQIIAVLEDAQAGVRVQDLCRKQGISMSHSIGGGGNTRAWKSAT
jgi:hypothetical protein